jgi:hypothetical protein
MTNTAFFVNFPYLFANQQKRENRAFTVNLLQGCGFSTKKYSNLQSSLLGLTFKYSRFAANYIYLLRNRKGEKNEN